jgi:hypothetical protein
MIERRGRRYDGFIGGSVNAQLRFGFVTDNTRHFTTYSRRFAVEKIQVASTKKKCHALPVRHFRSGTTFPGLNSKPAKDIAKNI